MNSLPNNPKTNSYDVANCPICKVDSGKIMIQDHEHKKYLQCTICNTIYVSPRLNQSSRNYLLEKKFGLNESTIQMNYSRLPALAYEAKIIQNYQNSGKLLDIGCGAGDFFGFFSENSWQYYGVEISSSIAQVAASRYNAFVHIGQLSTASFQNESFNLITMIDMLYYLDDPLSDLSLVRRLIHSEGTLGIEIPGQSYMFQRSRGLINLLMNGQWNRLNSDTPDLNWFSISGLAKLLELSGFRILDWYIVSSPKTTYLKSIIVDGYVNFIRRIAKRWDRYLSWAPKILFIIKPI